MTLKSVLKKAYRLSHSYGVEKFVLPFVFSRKKLETLRMEAAKSSQSAAKRSALVSAKTKSNALTLNSAATEGAPQVARIWFHAASAGELESLWPLIVLAGGDKSGIVVTILSESGWSGLERLRQKLQEIGAFVLFMGYSPWEGGWGSRLEEFKPDFFVTVKYEAWPDLWMSLQEHKIPLVIIGARVRRSLRLAKKMTEFLTGELPRLFLFPCDPQDAEDLSVLFPQATLRVVDEPRWERVFDRAKSGNLRAVELTRACRLLPRPWGVIGNAWLEDLRFLFGTGSSKLFQGTLWIVPHQLKAGNIAKIEAFLTRQGMSYVATQGLSVEALALRLRSPCNPGGTAGSSCVSPSVSPSVSPCVSPRVSPWGTSALPAVLVNEMGFLSELYSSADWAYVGGGFGAGIHSTIEPAIHGIPIAIGPEGAQKFSEVGQLQRTGQLSLLRDSTDLSAWMDQWEVGQLGTRTHKFQENKSRWKKEAESRCGGASQILCSLFEGNK